MEIKSLGHSCLQVTGRKVSVVIDPYQSGKLGYNFPKVSADIVISTHGHDDHNNTKGVSGGPFVIDTAGEYEVKGVHVYGVRSWHDDEGGIKRGENIVYLIQIDGLNLVHLGDLGHKLESEQVEELNTVDILMIPTGGTYTINAETATEVLAQLEPYIVIPMHYQTKKLTGLTQKLDGVEKFLDAMGVENVRKVSSLKIKNRGELPQETEVVVLDGV